MSKARKVRWFDEWSFHEKAPSSKLFNSNSDLANNGRTSILSNFSWIVKVSGKNKLKTHLREPHCNPRNVNRILAWPLIEVLDQSRWHGIGPVRTTVVEEKIRRVGWFQALKKMVNIWASTMFICPDRGYHTEATWHQRSHAAMHVGENWHFFTPNLVTFTLHRQKQHESNSLISSFSG